MANKILPYNPKLKILARELRKNSTLSEVLLWKELKNRKLGFEFHRQVPIKNYIVDFFCHELMLAIEVDGSTHDNEQQFQLDQIRQSEIEELGVHFIRIDDLEIKTNLEGVIDFIRRNLQHLN